MELGQDPDGAVEGGREHEIQMVSRKDGPVVNKRKVVCRLIMRHVNWYKYGFTGETWAHYIEILCRSF